MIRRANILRCKPMRGSTDGGDWKSIKWVEAPPPQEGARSPRSRRRRNNYRNISQRRDRNRRRTLAGKHGAEISPLVVEAAILHDDYANRMRTVRNSARRARCGQVGKLPRDEAAAIMAKYAKSGKSTGTRSIPKRSKRATCNADRCLGEVRCTEVLVQCRRSRDSGTTLNGLRKTNVTVCGCHTRTALMRRRLRCGDARRELAGLLPSAICDLDGILHAQRSPLVRRIAALGSVGLQAAGTKSYPSSCRPGRDGDFH